MKKVLAFIFILTLILCLASCKQGNDNQQSEHKVHLDENGDGLCDGCHGVMIDNSGTSLVGTTLKNSLEKQFNEAKSMKIDIKYETIRESEQWYYERYYDSELGEYVYTDIPSRNAFYYENTHKIEVWLSKTENGVNAKMISNLKSRSFPEDEFEESEIETIYYIDGYQYSYLQDGLFIKREVDGTMVDLLEKLSKVELLDEDAQDKLLSAFSEEIATVFNFQTYQGSVSIDAKPTIDKFVNYFGALDCDKNTAREVIDFTLSQISSDLSSKAILDELRHLSDLTVYEALDELDKWLTENHQTTLQSIIDKLVNDPGVLSAVEAYIINSGSLNPDDAEDKETIDEILSKIKSFNIRTFISEQGVGDTIVFSLLSQILPSKSTDDNTGEVTYYTADEVFDNIDYMLDLTINELADYLENYSSVLSSFVTVLINIVSNLDVKECNLKVDMNFNDLFSLVSVDGSLNVDFEVHSPSEIENKENYVRLYIYADFTIHEISSEEKDISIHRSATIINNRYTDGKSYVNVNIDIYGDNYVYLYFSIYDEATGNEIEVDVSTSLDNINQEITENISYFHVHSGNNTESHRFYNSQKFSVILSHETGTFRIIKMPDWSKDLYY